jgi:hypothetical protein
VVGDGLCTPEIPLHVEAKFILVLAIRHKNKRPARMMTIQKLQDFESKILRIPNVLNKGKWFRGLKVLNINQ